MNRTLKSQILLSLLLLASCKQRTYNDSKANQTNTTSNQQLSAQSQKLWDKYVKKTKQLSIQKNCEPTHFAPQPQIKYRGLVIMYHGYTACPQQYFEWARLLTQDGFHVLMPLSPGHGLVPKANGDDVTLLPNIAEMNNGFSKYSELVLTMNEIAKEAEGEKIIVGLSVGGAMATHATILEPNLYDRAIMFAPFYSIDDGFMREVLHILNAFKELPITDPIFKKRHSWGQGCLDERRAGRAGICDFLLGNLAAAEQYGQDVISKLNPSAHTQYQFVGSESDKVASVGHIKSTADTLAKLKPESVTLCLFKSGANHSLISRFDSPIEDKFWITSILKHGTQYVSNGTKFPDDGIDSLVPSIKHCKTE